MDCVLCNILFISEALVIRWVVYLEFGRITTSSSDQINPRLTWVLNLSSWPEQHLLLSLARESSVTMTPLKDKWVKQGPTLSQRALGFVRNCSSKVMKVSLEIYIRGVDVVDDVNPDWSNIFSVNEKPCLSQSLTWSWIPDISKCSNRPTEYSSTQHNGLNINWWIAWYLWKLIL